MSVTKIQFKRGLAANIPAATSSNIGEPLWATDSKKLFVSNGNENVEIGAVAITNTLQSGTAIATINGTTIYSPAHVKPDWNAASGADAEILNKPTIPTITVNDLLSTGNTVATISDGTTTWTVKAPAAGSPSVEELTASSYSTGGFRMKTNNGSNYVSVISGTGSTATFTVDTTDAANTLVTMDITVVDGGTW